MKNRQKSGILIMAFALISLFPSPAQSERTHERFRMFYEFKPVFYWGFGGGFNVIGSKNYIELCPLNSWQKPNECMDSRIGGGIVVFGGMRPHKLFSIDLSWDLFLHPGKESYDNATLQSLRLDLKFYIIPGLIIEPYLQGGGGLYWFGETYSWDRGGGGFQVGGGLDILWAKGFSTDLQALYRGAYFWGSESRSGNFKSLYISNFFLVLKFTFRYFIS